MYERTRGRNVGTRGGPRSGKPRRSRERSPPPRLRSPVGRSPPRDRQRPKFERNRSRERFHRRPSRDRSPPRFERARSGERFEPPRPLFDEPLGRFEPPPREVFIERARPLDDDRYVPPPTPRFEERMEVLEPVAIERKLNFECPGDNKFMPAVEDRFERFPPGPETSIKLETKPPTRHHLKESSPQPPFVPPTENESNDKSDPWSNALSQTRDGITQLEPTFGQEKGSSLIPDFDPDNSDINANTFIKIIEKVGQEKGWSGHDRKFQLSMKLKGSAKEWFLQGNKFLESWSAIKKQFRHHFPSDMDYYMNLSHMIQRTKKPEEDLSTYFNYKIAMLRNCNITGRKAVSCLIGGLPDSMFEIKNNAYDKNYATAEELYKFLVEQEVDGGEETKANSSSVPKCLMCGKRGYCDCRKADTMITSPSDDRASSAKDRRKCYKDVFIAGKKLKALYDEAFPYITIRESDVDFLKIKYRRQITIIPGYDRATITSLGYTPIMIKVDSLFTEMTFYVVKDNAQETPVILGRTSLKFPHVDDGNGLFFTADEKTKDYEERSESRNHPMIELRRSRSPPPIRRNPHDYEYSMRRGGSPGVDRRLSPPRRSSPPGRIYKEPQLFLSQFYGNPYA